MQVLIIGGTGLISRGIVKQLLTRGAEVTVFNRAQREDTLPPEVKRIRGDRNHFNEYEQTMLATRFDVVIDMVCFGPEQAAGAVGAFGGRCQQFIFCSTVCTYGVKVPPGVLIDESFPQEPISEYGRNKVACEKILRRAHDDRRFQLTIIRPSHTYGPGAPLIDNLEPDAVAWDRIERGQPVLCAGDGLGLWQSTHRDDVGKLFAYAALNPRAYGQEYNATRDEIVTWRDYYRHVAAALGKPARLIFMPAAWIVGHDPQRFNLLHEITQFHGAYDSSKARRDVPEFRCEIDLTRGAAGTFADIRRRNVWRDSRADSLYQGMIDEALATGVEPVPA
ncbi:MAG TPA: NAD-dependent epimerase/dehydratase family protein [Verrucomicrobiae bacterium]|nr:NAD-dependent epimerase/dehydratase family protein [Verrucomicrobiae bacterium]